MSSYSVSDHNDIVPRCVLASFIYLAMHDLIADMCYTIVVCIALTRRHIMWCRLHIMLSKVPFRPALEKLMLEWLVARASQSEQQHFEESVRIRQVLGMNVR